MNPQPKQSNKGSTCRWLPSIFALLLLLPTVAWGQVKQTYEVTTADGAKLHTIVLLPGDGKGKWPAILVRSPYPLNPNADFTKAGVALVEQNTRGRYQSTGKDTIFGNDRDDGAATVAWLHKQPWCNGRIATFGGSALALTQYMMAQKVGNQIAAQLAMVGNIDLYSNVFFTGGVFRYELVYNWLVNQATSNNIPPPHPMLAAFEKEALSGTPFWQTRKVTEWANVAAPAIHVGGWYDIFHQGTIDAFLGYTQQAAPSVRDKQILIMGPWAHEIGQSKVGELSYPNRSETYAEVTLAQLLLGMIDKYLKQTSTTNWGPLTPVNVYVMGAVGEPNAPGNQWVHAQTWPPPTTQLKVYLRGNQRLTTDPPQAGEGKESFSYDPKNPVPTVGGSNLNIAPGPLDQRKIESRKDVLIFNSDVLPDAVPVIGRIKAYLWVSTDAKDTDFTVKLTDVYPDGRSMLVLDSIIRLRHRNTTSKEEFVTPGQIVPVTIDLGSTALIFNKGHRIRVALSSSNAPRFSPNPNTGAPFAIVPKQFVIAQNNVYHEPQHSSYIELPIADINKWLRPNTQEPAVEPVVSDAGSESTPESTPEPTKEPNTEQKPPFEGPSPQEPKLPETSSPPEPTAAEQLPPEPSPPSPGCGCQGDPGTPMFGCILLICLCLVSARRRRQSL